MRKMLELCLDAKLLDLTATNVCYLDNNRDMDEPYKGHIVSRMTLGKAISLGILSISKYVITGCSSAKTS